MTRTKRLVLGLSGLLALLAGCTGSSRPSGQPTVQGAAMQRMLADIEAVRAFVYGGGSQKDAEAAADDLVSWSERMSDLFPPGQSTAEYVDMSPARVRNAPIAMKRSSQDLLAAVRTGNRSTAGDQLALTERNGCGACHLSSAR